MNTNKSKSKKAYYNILTSGINEVVTLLCGLVLPHFILRQFGSSDNGLISSITQFLNYISILSLGISGPTRVALYKSLNDKNDKATSSILKANENFYRKISAVFFFFFVILAVVFPYLAENDHTPLETGLLVIIIGIGIFSEYFFGITYSTLLTADQTIYIYTTIKIICRLLNTVLAILLIQLHFSIIVVEFGIAVFNTLQPLVLYRIVRKKYKIDKHAKPDKRALRQRGDAAASSIANIIHDKTDVVVLTVFAGTATVSVYSVYMIVMNGLISVMRVFTNSLEAPFGNFWVRKDDNALHRYMRLYEAFIYSFVAVFFTCTGLLLLPFISLYTAKVTDINYLIPSFAFILTITTAVFCIRQPYLTMVQAAGKYKENKVGNIIEACLNIILSLLLVQRIGLLGVTIGTLVANLYRTIQYSIYMSKHLIKRSMTEVIKRFVWLIFTCGATVCVCCLIPDFIQYTNWIEWLFSGVKCFTISVIVTGLMLYLFYRNDLISLLKMGKKMILK